MPKARSAAPSCSKPSRKSYHGPGTCTFYGTANSNQMLMEIMGLHLPGASFVNPGTPLRDALTREAAKRALAITALGNDYTPVGRMIDERSIVNGVVGLHATGGSTNHTHPSDRHGGGGRHRHHLAGHFRPVGSRAAAGARLSERARRREPFPCRRRHGLPDPRTARRGPPARGRADRLGRRACGLCGRGRSSARTAAWCARPSPAESGDAKVLRAVREAVPADRRAEGADGQSRPRRHQDLGGASRSAASSRRRRGSSTASRGCTTPSRPASSTGDFIAVVRFQGPKANGMPELHKLTTALGVLQDRGQQGGAGHRRAHVGRLRQGAGGDPCDAGSARRRRRSARSATATSSGSTPTPARSKCWCRAPNLQCARSRRLISPATNLASAANCSPASGSWSAAPTTARRLRDQLIRRVLW